MKKGLFKGVATLFVAGILAGGVCAAGYASRNDSGKWFKNSDIASWHWSDKNKPQEENPTAQTWGGVIDNVGNELNAETTYAMPAAMAFYATTSPELAELHNLVAPSVTVTCSHNLEYNNVFVDWEIEDENGDEVTSSAVTVTPTSDGSLTATLTCSEEFTQSLLLKVTSRDNNNHVATCKIDFVKRISNFEFNMGASDFGDYFGEQISPTFSSGSIYADTITANITYSINDDFISDFKSYLKFNVNVKSYKQQIDLKLSSEFYEPRNSSITDWGMFIENFDNYDLAHKEAIYYAWFTAFNSSRYYSNAGNVIVDMTGTLKYNGVEIQSNLILADYQNFAYPNRLNGDCDGCEIEPNLTLTNVAF
ncbi:MAG: hypothetical protein K2N23_05425 [Clostridia bacterium]|nr:hypothetical protein [Clostridia bacterium]